MVSSLELEQNIVRRRIPFPFFLEKRWKRQAEREEGRTTWSLPSNDRLRVNPSDIFSLFIALFFFLHIDPRANFKSIPFFSDPE